MAKGFMNPNWGSARHNAETATAEAEPEPGGDQFKGEEQQAQTSPHPHIFIHSHASGHTVHVHHKAKDGGKPKHEMHEHELGDHEGVANRVKQVLGGEQSNEHSGADETEF